MIGETGIRKLAEGHIFRAPTLIEEAGAEQFLTRLSPDSAGFCLPFRF